MKQIKLLLLVVFVTLSSQSCKDKEENKSPENRSDAIEVSTIDEKQAFINKYNVYVDVWNSVSPSLERAHKYLTNNLDKTGKPRQSQASYFIAKASSVTSIRNLEDVIDELPKIPELDGLGKNLISSFKALESPLEKLSDYYETKSYLDDDFKTSVELYPVVMKNLSDYLSTSDNLGKELEALDVRLQNEELEKYKEDGLEILYARGKLINTIKKQSALLRGIDFKSYENIDFDKFDAELKEVIKLHNSFKKFSKDPTRLKKELNMSNPARLTTFNLAVDKFVKESRNLKSMATDSKKYAKMIKTVESMGIQFANESHLKVFKASEEVINQSNFMN